MSKFKLAQTAAEVQNILNNFNSLKSDAEGNLTASKNLKVDGKLKLASLISDTNPDGDVAKELAGNVARHGYRIIGNNTFHYTVDTTKNYNFKIGKVNEISDFKTNDNYKELRAVGRYPAAGYFENAFNKLILNTFTMRDDGYYGFDGYDVKSSETQSFYVDRDSVRFFYVVQLY